MGRPCRLEQKNAAKTGTRTPWPQGFTPVPHTKEPHIRGKAAQGA